MDMEQLSLFDTEAVYDPLASRMRPEDLDEFAGQTNLLGKGKLLRQLIEQDRIPSMIFWGPPGVGKTTLAGIFAAVQLGPAVSKTILSKGKKQLVNGSGQAVFKILMSSIKCLSKQRLLGKKESNSAIL